MKPEPTFPRCNKPARHYSPIGYARCRACLKRHGREGFAVLPNVDTDLRCDEPVWSDPSWQEWMSRQRRGWITPERMAAP